MTSSNWWRRNRSPPAGRIRKVSGAWSPFHGQMGMFVRALAYMKSHGADGLRQVAEDAVLNANYRASRSLRA